MSQLLHLHDEHLVSPLSSSMMLRCPKYKRLQLHIKPTSGSGLGPNTQSQAVCARGSVAQQVRYSQTIDTVLLLMFPQCFSRSFPIDIICVIIEHATFSTLKNLVLVDHATSHEAAKHLWRACLLNFSRINVIEDVIAFLQSSEKVRWFRRLDVSATYVMRDEQFSRFVVHFVGALKQTRRLSYLRVASYMRSREMNEALSSQPFAPGLLSFGTDNHEGLEDFWAAHPRITHLYLSNEINEHSIEHSIVNLPAPLPALSFLAVKSVESLSIIRGSPVAELFLEADVDVDDQGPTPNPLQSRLMEAISYSSMPITRLAVDMLEVTPQWLIAISPSLPQVRHLLIPFIRGSAESLYYAPDLLALCLLRSFPLLETLAWSHFAPPRESWVEEQEEDLFSTMDLINLDVTEADEEVFMTSLLAFRHLRIVQVDWHSLRPGKKRQYSRSSLDGPWSSIVEFPSRSPMSMLDNLRRDHGFRS